MSLEGYAPEIMLRITEFMPDPIEPGSDADFEWVEVTNIGVEPISLAGIRLRDNREMLALPDMVLAPGASLVIAGPRAAVPEASAVRMTEGLFNGLGNSGDRLALLAADGRTIDALSYGADTTFDNPSLPVPGAGRSLKRYFGDDGAYTTHEVADVPSPGRIEPAPVSLEAGAEEGSGGSSLPGVALEVGDSTDWTSWLVLGGLGTVFLVAAGGQQLWTRWRRD
jgi:hypothetical protein